MPLTLAWAQAQTSSQLELVQKQLEALEDMRFNQTLTEATTETVRVLKPLTTDKAVSKTADVLDDMADAMDRVQEASPHTMRLTQFKLQTAIRMRMPYAMQYECEYHMRMPVKLQMPHVD